MADVPSVLVAIIGKGYQKIEDLSDSFGLMMAFSLALTLKKRGILYMCIAKEGWMLVSILNVQPPRPKSALVFALRLMAAELRDRFWFLELILQRIHRELCLVERRV